MNIERAQRQTLRHRHFYLAVIVFLIFGFGCNRGGGISAGPGSPSTSPSQDVSNSAQVVRVTVSQIEVARGGSADSLVNLSITPGYHINANPATYSYLIATELNAEKVEAIKTDKPKYPVAKTQRFEFAEEPLAVYEGDVQIRLPLNVLVEKVAPGERSLPITVRVQACDNTKCFPPATLAATIPVVVK